MLLEGVFVQQNSSSSKQTPDLSLHISPPNSSSSSTRTTHNNSLTELCLAHPTTTNNEENKSFSRNPFLQQSQNMNSYHGVSLLDPIKGIPIYHHHQDPKRSSSFGSIYHNNLDHISYSNNSYVTNVASSSPYNRIPIVANRFQNQQHIYYNGVGLLGSPSSHESNNFLMRSRFLPKFPTKRSMRAPRMRWTTSLHARFVHAVELLGGHESKHSIYLSIPYFEFFFFFYICNALVCVHESNNFIFLKMFSILWLIMVHERKPQIFIFDFRVH